MWASLSGQLEVVEWLVTECAQAAEYATEKGETPLMKAAAAGHWNVCKYLIDQVHFARLSFSYLEHIICFLRIKC
jgi:hypothetical protein